METNSGNHEKAVGDKTVHTTPQQLSKSNDNVRDGTSNTNKQEVSDGTTTSNSQNNKTLISFVASTKDDSDNEVDEIVYNDDFWNRAFESFNLQEEFNLALKQAFLLRGQVTPDYTTPAITFGHGFWDHVHLLFSELKEPEKAAPQLIAELVSTLRMSGFPRAGFHKVRSDGSKFFVNWTTGALGHWFSYDPGSLVSVTTAKIEGWSESVTDAFITFGEEGLVSVQEKYIRSTNPTTRRMSDRLIDRTVTKYNLPGSLKKRICTITDNVIKTKDDECMKYFYFEFATTCALDIQVMPIQLFMGVPHYKPVTTRKSAIGSTARVCDLLGYPTVSFSVDWLFDALCADIGFITTFEHTIINDRFVIALPPYLSTAKFYMVQTEDGYMFSTTFVTSKVYERTTLTKRFRNAYNDMKEQVRSYHVFTRFLLMSAFSLLTWPFFGLGTAIAVYVAQFAIATFITKTIKTPFRKLVNGDYNQRIVYFMKWAAPLALIITLFYYFRKSKAIKEHSRRVFTHAKKAKTTGYTPIGGDDEVGFDERGRAESKFPINPKFLALTKDTLDAITNTYKGIAMFSPNSVKVPVWLMGVSYAVTAIVSLSKVVTNPFASYFGESFVHYVELFDTFVKENAKKLVDGRYCHHGKALVVEIDDAGREVVIGCDKCTVARWWQKVSNWFLICLAAVLVISLSIFWYYKLRNKEKRDELVDTIKNKYQTAEEKLKSLLSTSEDEVKKLREQMDDNYHNYKQKFYDLTKKMLSHLKPDQMTTFPESAKLFVDAPADWLQNYENGSSAQRRQLLQSLVDARLLLPNSEWSLITDQAKIFLRAQEPPTANVISTVFNLVSEHGSKNHNKARDEKYEAREGMREHNTHYQDHSAKERARMEAGLDDFRVQNSAPKAPKSIPPKASVELDKMYSDFDDSSILMKVAQFMRGKAEQPPNIVSINTNSGSTVSKTAIDLRAWLNSISSILTYASEKDIAFLEKGYKQAWVLPHREELPSLSDEDYATRITDLITTLQARVEHLNDVMLITAPRGELQKPFNPNNYEPRVVINSMRQLNKVLSHKQMGVTTPGNNIVQLENQTAGGVISDFSFGLVQRLKSGGIVIYGAKHCLSNTKPILVHHSGTALDSQGVPTHIKTKQAVVQAYYSKEQVDPAIVIINNPFLDDRGSNLQLDIPKVEFYIKAREPANPVTVQAFMFVTDNDTGSILPRNKLKVCHFEVLIDDRFFGAKAHIKLHDSGDKTYFKPGMSGMPIFTASGKYLGPYYGTIGGKPKLSLVHEIDEIRTHVQQHGNERTLADQINNGALCVFAESTVNMPQKKNNTHVNEKDKVRTARVDELQENSPTLKAFMNSADSKRVTGLYKISDITGPAHNLKKFSVFAPPINVDQECAAHADEMLFVVLSKYLKNVDPSDGDFDASFDRFWTKLTNYCLGEKKDKSSGWWGKQRGLLTKGEVFKDAQAHADLKKQVYEELSNPDWQLTPVVYFDQKSELRDATKPPRVYAPCDIVVFAKEFYYCYNMLNCVEGVPIAFKRSTMSESEWEGNVDQWLHHLMEIAESEDYITGSDFINYDGTRSSYIERRVIDIMSRFFTFSRNGFVNFMKSQCAVRMGVAYFKPHETNFKTLLDEVVYWQKIEKEAILRADSAKTNEARIQINALIAKFSESFSQTKDPMALMWYLFLLYNGGSSGRLTTLFMNTQIHMWQMFYAWCRNLKENSITDHVYILHWDQFIRFLILADDRWLAVGREARNFPVPFDDFYFQKIAKEFGMNVEPPDGVIPITQNVYCSKYPVPIRSKNGTFYAFRINRDRLIAMINYFRRSSEHYEPSVFYAKLTQFRMFLSLPVDASGNLASKNEEDVHADLRRTVDEILREIRIYLYNLRSSPNYTQEQLEEIKRQVFNIPIVPYDTLVMHFFPKQHGSRDRCSIINYVADGPSGNRNLATREEAQLYVDSLVEYAWLNDHVVVSCNAMVMADIIIRRYNLLSDATHQQFVTDIQNRVTGITIATDLAYQSQIWFNKLSADYETQFYMREFIEQWFHEYAIVSFRAIAPELRSYIGMAFGNGALRAYVEAVVIPGLDRDLSLEEQVIVDDISNMLEYLGFQNRPRDRPSATDASGPPGNRQKTESEKESEARNLIPILKEVCYIMKMQFKFHGNYGGPGYSNGRFVGKNEEYHKNYDKSKQPVDLADVYYEQHDRDYSEAQQGRGSEKEADFNLARRLWNLGGVKNHFASFGMLLKALSGMELYGSSKKQAVIPKMVENKKKKIPKAKKATKMKMTQRKVIERATRKKVVAVPVKYAGKPTPVKKLAAAISKGKPTVRQSPVGRFNKPEITYGKNGARVKATVYWPMFDDAETFTAGEKIIKVIGHPSSFNDVFSKVANMYSWYKIEAINLDWETAMGTDAEGSFVFSCVNDPGSYDKYFDVADGDTINIQKAALINSKMFAANKHANWHLTSKDFTSVNKGWLPTQFTSDLTATDARQNVSAILQINAATTVVPRGYFCLTAFVQFKNFAYDEGCKTVVIECTKPATSTTNLLDGDVKYLGASDVALPLTICESSYDGDVYVMFSLGPQLNTYNRMQITGSAKLATYTDQVNPKVVLKEADGTSTVAELSAGKVTSGTTVPSLWNFSRTDFSETDYINIEGRRAFTIFLNSFSAGDKFRFTITFVADADMVPADFSWVKNAPFVASIDGHAPRKQKLKNKKVVPIVNTSPDYSSGMDDEEEEAYDEFVFSQDKPSTSEEDYVKAVVALGVPEAIAKIYYASNVTLETAIRLLTLSKKN